MTKKKTALRQITQPDGTSEVQYLDGSRDLYDAQGKLISGIVVTDAQIELWKKQPKEQALKEALELFKSQGMDISEARFKLEVLKFIADIQQVTTQVPNTSQIIAIRIDTGNIRNTKVLKTNAKETDIIPS
jgi:2C-methyl-D-erythritol 2,4-cyclodiphosphate synthase